MIKALGTAKDGRRVVLLGLSRLNTERLLDGKPIRVDLQAQLGVAGGDIILICAGETESDIAAELTKAGIGFPS
jgi:hypothetical protein